MTASETKISVGDTDPMQSGILWSWYKGLLVQSHQIICPWWPGEESPKLLTGLPVEVDGFPFVCRIPVLPDDQDVIEAVGLGLLSILVPEPKESQTAAHVQAAGQHQGQSGDKI